MLITVLQRARHEVQRRPIKILSHFYTRILLYRGADFLPVVVALETWCDARLDRWMLCMSRNLWVKFIDLGKSG